MCTTLMHHVWPVNDNGMGRATESSVLAATA